MDHAIAFIRSNQLRAHEYGGAPLPAFTVWDPATPDSRVRDPRKRGLIAGPWGPMSFTYCADCGRRAGIASPETMLKVFYRCPSCVKARGTPSDAIVVPGTQHV